MVEAEVSAEAYTRVAFDLWKNVAHVVISEEAAKKAVHDIMALNTADAARELPRMENKQIAEEAETATATSGGDWGLMTTPPDSDNNPFDDIIPKLGEIETAGYQPNMIAMHPLVWGEFIVNTFVRDLVHAGMVDLITGRISLPGFPTVQVITDYALTNTICLVLSTTAPALVMGEGPTEAAKYRSEPAGYSAFIIKQYLQPQLILADAIDRLTGVRA